MQEGEGEKLQREGGTEGDRTDSDQVEQPGRLITYIPPDCPRSEVITAILSDDSP